MHGTVMRYLIIYVFVLQHGKLSTGIICMVYLYVSLEFLNIQFILVQIS